MSLTRHMFKKWGGGIRTIAEAAVEAGETEQRELGLND